MNKIKHNFTLLEILVAVAVLVIMMGFLLQFTGSAQKIWAANTARTEMSAQADAIFSLLKEDLEHIYIVEAYEDLDAQSGWYCRHTDGTSANDTPFATSGKNLEDFCFFTQATDGIENYTPGSGRSLIYGVRYHFEPKDPTDEDSIGKLYRFETNVSTWDRITDLELSATTGLPTKNIAGENALSPDWYCVAPSSQDDYLVAENIESIQIFSDAAVDEDNSPHTSAFIPSVPKYIRVNVVFSVPLNLRNGAANSEDTNRTFSRVFLVKK